MGRLSMRNLVQLQDNQIDMVKDNVSNKIVDGQTIKKGDVVFYMGPNIGTVRFDY